MSAFSFLSSKNRPRPARTRPRTKLVPLRVEALEDRNQPSGLTISGFVFHDLNNNGLMETGEAPIANNPIELHNADDVVVASTITDANGYYEFHTDATVDQTAHTLTKTVTFASTPTNFSLEGLLDQFDPSLGTLQEVAISHAGSITSEIKVENTSTSSGSLINGTVSGNLTLQAPGVNDQLSISQYAGTITAQTFDGTIDFQGASGTSFGQKTADGSNNIVLTGSDLTAYIGTGTVQVTEIAEASSRADGGGNVIVNVQSTGQATVTVVYKYIANNTLQPGTYTIVETEEPPGYFPGKNSSNGTVLTTPPGTNVIPVTLTTGNAPHNDFGKLQASSLAGTVYFDANDNGTLDGGEVGIAGVSVTLTGTDVTGTAIHLTETTDADGDYKFATVRDGTYTVTETQPADYLDGATNVGSAGGTAALNEVANIALPPNTNAVNYNFGELKGGSVAGFVYEDANENGTKDAGDPGIPNTVVALTGTDDNNAPVSEQTTTDANGAYKFAGLRAGTYTVTETQPAGYLDAADSAGTLGGTVGDDVISAIQVGMGQDGENYNFGETLPGNSDLGIVKMANVPVSSYGDQLTYTLRVTNHGAGNAHGVVVNDLLPPGVTYVSASGDGWTVTQANGTITALRPFLAVGATSDIAVIVQVPSFNATLTNFSQVGSTTPDGNPTNNTSSVTTTVQGTPGIVTSTSTPPLAIVLADLPISSKSQVMARADPRDLDPNILGKVAMVEGLYQTVTGSSADPTTARLFTRALLDGTTTPELIVATAWASDAHRTLQARQLYQTFLGRTPSAAEQATVVQALKSGATEQSQVLALATSAEFQQMHATAGGLATALSQNILGQSMNGVAAQQLAQSMGNQTLAQAVGSLLASPDALNRTVDQAYRNTVRRAATAAELAQWTPQLQAGTITAEAIAQKLLASQEFYQLAYNSVV